MIKHDIENHLNPILLQLVYQLFQLISLMIMFHHRRVARVWRKKADRIITPVIVELFPVHNPGALHLVKFKDRHQLHSIDPEVFQIRDLLTESLISPLRRHTGRLVPGKAPHMHLIDDQILQRELKLLHISPVKIILHNPRMIDKPLVILRPLAPVPLPRHRLRVRVQQDMILIKQQPLLPVVRAVQLKSILKFLDFQTKHQH